MMSPERETTYAFVNDLMRMLTNRGRALLRSPRKLGGGEPVDLEAVGELLLSRRGEASGAELALQLHEGYAQASTERRLGFLCALAERFGADQGALQKAIAAYQARPAAETILTLHQAAEPRRQELIRRLNHSPGGIFSLVKIREELLGYLAGRPELAVVDADFTHLFVSWFNRGFLVLKPIDWRTSANILEKIIQYEAVHAIQDWIDLRSRIDPTDRRCFGFFHPQLLDEPLIFVEVALTAEIPAAVGPLLDRSRTPIAAEEATTAVFYSISNTQKGLAGVSFGSFLIKQVVEDLKRELPNLKSFVTLSPVPGFANWLARERQAEASACLNGSEKEALQTLDDRDWYRNPERVETVREVLLDAASSYFLRAKTAKGLPVDAVARFHLGNGARLERLNFLGDVSVKGLKQSHGLMVNYLYVLDDIEQNHEAFAEKGKIVASSSVLKARRFPSSHAVVPMS